MNRSTVNIHVQEFDWPSGFCVGVELLASILTPNNHLIQLICFPYDCIFLPFSPLPSPALPSLPFPFLFICMGVLPACRGHRVPLDLELELIVSSQVGAGDLTLVL